MKAERESLAFENLGYSGGSNNVIGQADLGEEVSVEDCRLYARHAVM